MKRYLLALLVCGLLVGAAQGYLVTIVNDPVSGQDATNIQGVVHELGLQPPFPPDETIRATWDVTEYRPCPQNPDLTIPNIVVSISNLTQIYWTDLHYVADSETTFQNYDINRLNGMLAFKIDNIGVNTPLIKESMNPDLIFEPGETWDFVIQDYVNQFGLSAASLDSLGVPSGSPPSSGSIIGIPEPGTLVILGCGLWTLVRRRI